MNKTLIIFGLLIIFIGVLVAVLKISKKSESFNNFLRTITETFSENHK